MRVKVKLGNSTQAQATAMLKKMFEEALTCEPLIAYVKLALLGDHAVVVDLNGTAPAHDYVIVLNRR